jgi:hypothetical protein
LQNIIAPYESHIKEKKENFNKLAKKKGYAFPFAKFALVDLFPWLSKMT